MKKISIFSLLLLVVIIFSSCEKETVIDANENSSIVDLNYEEPELQLEERNCNLHSISATFNGVPAYVNCPIGSANSYGSSFVNGVYVGLKWQCVEYVQRYYFIVYKLNIKPAFGNANSFFTNNNHTSVGLVKFANGSVMPEVGDILVSTSNTFGHVAIVRGVGSNFVDIIDQNFSSVSARRLSLSGNRIGNFNASYPVHGLVRRFKPVPASIPTLQSPANNATNLVAPIRLTWSCPNGTEYRVQIIERNNFRAFSAQTGFSGTLSYNQNLGNITSFNWTQPKSKTQYLWIVRAANTSGHSQFSQPRTFTTK